MSSRKRMGIGADPSSSPVEETLTRVDPHDETTNDEHLKRTRPLSQGQQQSSNHCKAVIQEQHALPELIEEHYREREH